MNAGTAEFFKKYQARAGAEGVDPLGYYLGGWGYAYIQLLGEAIAGSKSIDDNKIADYLRKNTFKTIMGDFKFGGWRVGEVRHDAGAVSWHQGRRRPRYLARHELPDGAYARRSQDRQRDLSVREGEAVARSTLK